MYNKVLLICFVLASSLALSSCLEDFQITLHEPGQYMGPEDPLVDKGSQSSVLAKRFNAGQIDR